MTDKAAISGTYSDFKIIRTRSTIQIVVEVPLEAGQHVIDRLGLPNPQEEIHVAVARLESQPVRETEPKPRSYAQRAGILSNDPVFWRFIDETGGIWGGFLPRDGRNLSREDSVNHAAEYIRERCDVTSRRDLIEGTDAGRKFLDLEASFKVWMSAP